MHGQGYVTMELGWGIAWHDGVPLLNSLPNPANPPQPTTAAWNYTRDEACLKYLLLYSE